MIAIAYGARNVLPLSGKNYTIMGRNIWKLGEFSRFQKFHSLARMLTIHSVNSDGFSCTVPSDYLLGSALTEILSLLELRYKGPKFQVYVETRPLKLLYSQRHYWRNKIYFFYFFLLEDREFVRSLRYTMCWKVSFQLQGEFD